jgi:hypothetical protein
MGQTTFSGPVKSDNGFIENSFTTAQLLALPNPTIGLLVYNTTANEYQVYNGSSFVPAFAAPIVYPLPNVDTFTPTSGTTDGGTTLTVTGTNFTYNGSGNVSFASIDFGSGIVYPLDNITVNSDTEFTCDTTPSYGGAYTGGHLSAYNPNTFAGTASSTTFDYTSPA